MRDKPKRSLFDGYPDAEELERAFQTPISLGEDDPDAPHDMDCACAECDPVRAYQIGGKGALVND